MRPIKLTMYGFMSYYEKTVINFEPFGTTGTYLISGDTGSGKTSIFDALKFALYGKTSGSERDSNSLVSTPIRDAIENGEENAPKRKNRPYVELVFQVQGKTYIIKRWPKVEKVFGISTPWNEEREFYDEERTFSMTGENEIKSQILDIIGLNADQFSSVAMIAQGEFTKLVCAKAEERGEILKSIFSTSKFSTLDRILKTHYDDAEKETEDSENFIKGYINQIRGTLGNSDEALTEAFEASYGENYEKFISIIEAYISSKKDEIAKLDAEIKSKKDELSSAEESLKRFSDKKKLEDEIKDLESEIEKLSAKKETAEKKLAEIKSRSEEIDEIRKQITLLESLLPKYRELTATVKRCEKLEGEITADRKNIEAKEKAISAAKATLEQIKTRIEEIGDVDIEIFKKKAYLEDFSALIEKLAKFNELSEETGAAYSVLAFKERHIFRYEQNYHEISANYHSNLACILAKELGENMPCPVCGSTEHPHIATSKTKIVTKEDVEEAEQALNDAKKELDEQKALAEKSRDELDRTSRDIEELAKKLSLDESDPSLLDEDDLKTEKAELEEELKALEAAKKEKAELLKRIEVISAQLEKDKASIGDLRIRLAAAEQELKGEKQKAAGIRAELSFGTEAEANAEIDMLERTVNVYEADVRENNDTVNEIRNKLAGLNGALEEKKKARDEITLPKISEADLIEAIDKINSELNSLNASRKSINEILIKIEQPFELFKNELDAYGIALKKFEQYENLYKVVHGGWSKISFEKYILSVYFREIVNKANSHFSSITDNRYSFRTKPDGKLDLDVFDAWNGTTRDAKMLSGGEKFKAALSLALGFQEEMGGCGKLESLFIDEGFGSLSGDDLTAVMNLLEEQAGQNKLIGVISHVQEMKERLSHRMIEVKKNSNGSSSVSVNV